MYYYFFVLKNDQQKLQVFKKMHFFIIFTHSVRLKWKMNFQFHFFIGMAAIVKLLPKKKVFEIFYEQNNQTKKVE